MNSTAPLKTPRDESALDGTAAHPHGPTVEAIDTEVRALLADVQQLMQRIAHDADPAIIQLRTKVEAAMAMARSALAGGTERAAKEARSAIDRGDRYVAAQPWQAMGIAAVAGLILGIVVARR